MRILIIDDEDLIRRIGVVSLGQLGAEAVLTKPFDSVTLPGKVRALLEGH